MNKGCVRSLIVHATSHHICLDSKVHVGKKYLDMSLNWFHLLRANLASLSLMAVPKSNTRTSS